MSDRGYPDVWLHPLAYAPALLTALVASGWPTIFIGLERHELSDAEIERALQATRGAGGKAVMRCAEPSARAARRCVEAGADRIVVPMIESARQFAEIAGKIDAELVPLVETRRGIDDVAAIASLACVRTVFFGPYDLAADLGVGPWPHVLDALLPVLAPAFATARRCGKRVGCHVLMEWSQRLPHPEIDVVSCSLDDVARPTRSALVAAGLRGQAAAT